MTNEVTAWAVSRRADKSARAIFQEEEDAIIFATNLPVDLGKGIWTVYPWQVPADLFNAD